MRKISLVMSGALVFGLVGCSAAEPTRECIDVPREVMQSLAEGSNQYPITPIAAAAVRSHERANVTIIAMRFTEDASPGESLEGVWAVGGDLADYPGIGPWLSIDAIADLYSDFPNEMNGESFDITEDGAAEALACLDAA